MNGKSKCSDRDSPLSLTTLSTATLGYDGDDDGSWENGSWDSNHSEDVEMQHSNNDDCDSEASSCDSILEPPLLQLPNVRTSKVQCHDAPRPQSPSGESDAAISIIKTSELQCNCLELIMPLHHTENDIQNSRQNMIEEGIFHPIKLLPPDGTALKTLQNGKKVLVNYEKLLQNEITKRILLQRSMTKLQLQVKEGHEFNAKLIAANKEIQHLKETISKLKEKSTNETTRQLLPFHTHRWVQQKTKKSRNTCITLKVLLICCILWLAIMNVSVHTVVVTKLMEQQLNEGLERKKSFLRHTVKKKKKKLDNAKESADAPFYQGIKSNLTHNISQVKHVNHVVGLNATTFTNRNDTDSESGDKHETNNTVLYVNNTSTDVNVSAF